MRILELIKRTLCYYKIFLYGIKNQFKLNLGDVVIYKNIEYTLNQGVANPYWDLLSKNRTTIHLHKKTFKKKICWQNFIHDFQFAYSVYKGYWLDIWMRWSFNEIVGFTLKNNKWFNYGKGE